MKKLIFVPIFCIAVFLLTGCFPSERMYVVSECDSPALCGSLPEGSEFAFVKQARGSKYEIWVNQQPNVEGGPMLVVKNCEAPVEGDTFECDRCVTPNSFTIEKVSDSNCGGYDNCVKISMLNTQACPGGGTGKGGNNND